MTFSLCIWYVLPAPVSSWFSIVTCWKIIKVETMPSSVRMMWPAMIILHVPDLLHIIFSLPSSFSCQARSSLFCQCLASSLGKRTGMPWGVGKKDSLLCAPWFGKLESASAHALQYILLFNELQSPLFFSWFPSNYYPELKGGTRTVPDAIKMYLLKDWTFYLWVKMQFLFPFSSWLAQFLVSLNSVSYWGSCTSKRDSKTTASLKRLLQ